MNFKIPSFYKRILAFFVVIGPIFWLVFTEDGQRRTDIVLLTLWGEDEIALNLKALDKVIKLAESQGKEVSDFLDDLICPKCRQIGWGIEDLTTCHLCHTPMVNLVKSSHNRIQSFHKRAAALDDIESKFSEIKKIMETKNEPLCILAFSVFCCGSFVL